MTAKETRFGYPPDVWEAALSQIRAVLEDRAEHRRIITYGELTRELTAVRLHPHHPALPYMLDELDRASDARDGVMLAAIVRHATGDHMRGRRFFRTARELGRDVGGDPHAFWAGEVERVFARYAPRA
jgi:hypothetical protein